MTRGELYELVWARRISELAEELGLSANGLTKICDRLAIPYPSRSWWRQHDSGADPARPALPPAPPGACEEIAINERNVSRRGKRTRLSPEERREQLMDAAAAIVLQEGLHAVSLRRVSREIGLSEAQAHNCFPRRLDLLLAMARRELASLEARRRDEVSRGPDRLTRIIFSTLSYLRELSARGPLLQLLWADREVQETLHEERKLQRKQAGLPLIDNLVNREHMPQDIAYATTVIVNNICLRAGRMLAQGQISLQTAERLCLSIVIAADRNLENLGKTPPAPPLKSRRARTDARPPG